MTELGPAPDPPLDIIERIAKAMANPLRIRILMELNQRGPLSPSQFFRECGQDGDTESKVWRQFRQLEKYGLVEEVETRSGGRRRGGIEHFYRALQPAEFDTPSWAHLPSQFKAMFTASIFPTFVDRVVRAMDAGTIDSRSDRHLTWVTVPLDEEGWSKVIRRVDSFYHFMREEANLAEGRMSESDEQPIPATVALFVFESPQEELSQPAYD
jgi:DNA-binding transcriptional ArsR family regulator